MHINALVFVLNRAMVSIVFVSTVRLHSTFAREVDARVMIDKRSMSVPTILQVTRISNDRDA